MLKGLAISPGFALGKSFCLKHTQLENIEPSTLDEGEIPTEISRFKTALSVSRNEIAQLLELPQIKSSLEISNIFQAHLTLIDDPDLEKEVVKRVTEQKQDVKSVISSVIKDYSDFFKNLPDPQFQGKAIDILDVGKRILKNCMKGTSGKKDINELNEGIIIVAEDLTPSEIVGFNPQMILGIVIEEGTPTSHASILARSLGIPALIQVKDLVKTIENDSTIIIDGNSGKLITSPNQKEIEKYTAQKEKFLEKQKRILENLAKPSETTDGIKVVLNANIGQMSDLDAVINNNAEGIGLYRTEFAYLTRRTFPTEQELFERYSAVLKRLDNSEVVIRTIDIGGDKISHLMGNSMERNPELGWRAVRMALDCEDVFCTQLRAILRTISEAKADKVKVLFPMISNLSELKKVKSLLTRVRNQLLEEGVNVPKDIKLGIMVEIPSVALLAEKFATEVDFFSIGSNDLVQYTLAVDRTNSKVSHLYQPTNPAVIKLIKNVVNVANKYNIGISLCGEMAGDSRYTLLLLGLGLKELSMNAVLIPGIKQIIRNCSFKQAQELIEPLLDLGTAEEVDMALDKLNRQLGIL